MKSLLAENVTSTTERPPRASALRMQTVANNSSTERSLQTKYLSQGQVTNHNAGGNPKSISQSKWEAELRSIKKGFAVDALTCTEQTDIPAVNEQVESNVDDHVSAVARHIDLKHEKEPEKSIDHKSDEKNNIELSVDFAASAKVVDPISFHGNNAFSKSKISRSNSLPPHHVIPAPAVAFENAVDAQHEKESEKRNNKTMRSNSLPPLCAIPAPPATASVALKNTVNNDILHEGECYLALSMLVSIYTQLRKMSIMGCSFTSFADIDVNRHDLPMERDIYGNKTVSVDQKKIINRFRASNILFDQGNHHLMSGITKPFKHLNCTMKANSIIRIVIDEIDKWGVEDSSQFEHGLAARSRNENGLLAQREDYNIGIIREFGRWVNDSRTEGEHAAERTIHNIRQQVVLYNWKERLTLGFNHDDFNFEENKDDVLNSIKERKSLLQRTNSVQNGGWFRLQQRLVEDHFGIHNGTDAVTFSGTGGMLEPNNTPAALKSRRATTSGLTSEMVVEAFTSTLHNYFRDGSILSKMLKSDYEIVWCGDRRPNGAAYCIAANRMSNTVTIVFRGSQESHNPWHYALRDQRNPIAMENYRGHASYVGLHAGLCTYMLQKRENDGTRKIDEIFSFVHAIGTELNANGNYNVHVTGHGTGGALSTMFAFFAASDKRFTSFYNNEQRTIKVFTFASPRIGDKRFHDAFCHLEQTGRIQHARFSSTNDILTVKPLFSFHGLNVACYRHVGLHVRLHDAGISSEKKRRRPIDLSHDPEGYFSFLFLVIKNIIISNIAPFLGFTNVYEISEYQKRLQFAQTSDKDEEIKKVSKSLEEYYHTKLDSTVCVGHRSEQEQVGNNTEKTDDKFLGTYRLKRALSVEILAFCFITLLLVITEITLPFYSLRNNWGNFSSFYSRILESDSKQVTNFSSKAAESNSSISSIERGDGGKTFLKDDQRIHLDNISLPMLDVREKEERLPMSYFLTVTNNSPGLRKSDSELLRTILVLPQKIAFRSVSSWAFDSGIELSHLFTTNQVSNSEFIKLVVQSRSASKAAEQAVKVWAARHFTQNHMGRHIAREETKKYLIALINK
uniref:Fungal lipase-type domain-containing protein n=1 Tax=Ditylum brightwellii TaxID=49249 RepID=A0A7S1ZZX7_9STRA